MRPTRSTFRRNRTLSPAERAEEQRRIINALRGNGWVSRTVVVDELHARITAATLTDLLDELTTQGRVAMRTGPYGRRNSKVTQYKLTPVEGK